MREDNYDIISSFERNNWWYQGKRNLFNVLLRKTKRKFNSSLDMGCGVGSNFRVLKIFSKKVTGIDNSDKAIFYCKNKGYNSLYKRDALDTKFKKNSFDLILCSDVLEHIDDKKAVSEITRILKKGGILLLSVPAHNYLWGPTDIISKHKRRYEKRDLENILEKDFKIVKLGYWNFIMFLPNIFFLKINSLLGLQKNPKNTLQLIPKFLNKIIYTLLLIENRLFLKYSFIQGVSIIGICQKK